MTKVSNNGYTPFDKVLSNNAVYLALKKDFMSEIYVTLEVLLKKCTASNKMTNESFQAQLSYLKRRHYVVVDNGHVYLADNWRYQETAAAKLAKLRSAIPLTLSKDTADMIKSGPLCAEQKDAVQMALTNRLSLILGGAGSGKTTLIGQICRYGGTCLLAAPTGKAARNLEKRTMRQARTIHSALGLVPEEDYLSHPVNWLFVQTVVIDEASMMDIGMLAGILEHAGPDCRIVLVGDWRQLQSVGPGNVLPDLIKLGFPAKVLTENHRQNKDSSALYYNITNFDRIRSYRSLPVYILPRLSQGG